jgi:hypothetical protein
MGEIDRLIGLKRVKVFHLNDTKKSLGSRVDRHAHVGEGEIGLDAFRFLLNDRRFAGFPMVVETPKEKKRGRRQKKLGCASKFSPVKGANNYPKNLFFLAIQFFMEPWIRVSTLSEKNSPW